ncbi:MAG: DUF2079 domain-containing protein [archaeon]|nr:DUF2079 domain-containing protein [archaeon]MCP8313921.1 DUF2079 domain-containing protein [archaeon]
MKTYLRVLSYRIFTFLKSISKNIPKTLLISMIIYIFVFSSLLSFTHYNFSTYAWDTGIFNQVLWSTLNGKPFYYTVEPFLSPNNNFLATHFSPILLLVLPFYMIYPEVETLFVIHATVIAFGALAVYKLSRLILQNDKYSLVLALAYLLNPLVIGVTAEWFHLEDFFMALALFSIYFFFKKSWKIYFAFTILTLMSIEYAAIPVLFFGIFGILFWRRSSSRETKVLYIALMTIALATTWFVIAQNVRITLGYSAEGIISGWKILGADSLEQVPMRALMDPTAAWHALTYDWTAKSLYLLLTFAPLSFIAFLKPLHFLPALPWLVAALLSNYYQHYAIWTHYSSFIIPYLFLATIFGLKEFLDSSMAPYAKKLMKLFQTSVLVVSIMIIVWGALSYSYIQTSDNQRTTSIHEILGLVPGNASIFTQNNIFPHVSDRFEAYTIPSPIWTSKATEMLNITLAKKPEYIFIDLKANDQGSQATAELIHKTLYKARLPYGLLVANDGIYLFKLGYSGRPIMLMDTYDYRSLYLEDGRIVAYQDSKSGCVLYRDVNYANGTTFWFGPCAPLPPGNYTVTFHIMIGEPTNEYIMTIDVFAFDIKEQLAYASIYGSNFTEPMAWHNLTLRFEIDESSRMEFRGFDFFSVVDVYLDYIEVKLVEMISQGDSE